MSTPTIGELGTCGRCYAERVVVLPADCDDPRPFGNLGMYHCPDCGAMILGGLPHPALCLLCFMRAHPAFDAPGAGGDDGS